MNTSEQLCPIPRGVVAYITGSNSTSRLYALWKNGEMIVIQAPSLLDPDPEKISDERMAELDKIFLDGLEHLQTMIHTIEFGKTNWGYLVHHPKQGYEIVQKQRRLPKLTCHTWARLIPRSEISFTRFWPHLAIWNGYWKGHEVDVLMAYNDKSMCLLNREMWSYLALQGLDLTYRVFGHLVENDGTVVGLVYEAHVGRLIQYRDRAIVYDALSRVQQRSLVFSGAQEYTNIHIMNGKVRLANLCSLWYFPDENLCKEHADLRVWNIMEGWFPGLKTQNYIKPPYHRDWDQKVTMLPYISPDRPLFIRFTFGYRDGKDPAKRTDEALSLLRPNVHSHKRHSSSRGIYAARHLPLVGREVARRTRDFGRHSDLKEARMSRPYPKSFGTNPEDTGFSDTESDITAVDYETALVAKISPGRYLKFDSFTDSDTDTTYEAETC